MKISTLSSPNVNLAELSVQQLKEIKKVLNQFFLTAGTNIALYNALESKQTTLFTSLIQKALIYQVSHVAELKKIYYLLQALSKQEDDIIHEQIISDWIPFDRSIIGGRNAIFVFLLFAANEGGQSGLDKMIPQSSFQLTNESVIKQLEDRIPFLVKALDKTTIDWMIGLIKEGIKEGLSATQLVRMLRNEVLTMAKARGDLIAENELAVAMGALETEVFKRNGIQRVIWKTAHDERVEQICINNESAGPINLGENFPSGQSAPPAHLRCRCFTLPVLPYTIQGEIWVGQ